MIAGLRDFPFLRRALFADGYRVIGGISAVCAAVAVSKTTGLQILLPLVAVAFLYLGGKWRDFWRFHRIGRPPLDRSGPSWTFAFWAAAIAYLPLGLVLFGPVSWPAFAVLINIAYAGAKLGCMQIGCCRRYGKNIGERCSLAWCEAALSLAAATVVWVGYSISDAHWLGGLGITFHGAIRCTEYLLRFPYRRLAKQISDPASAGILLLGLIVFVVLWAPIAKT